MTTPVAQDTPQPEPGEPVDRRPTSLAELPLSPVQQRMWYLCTAYPGTSSPIIYLCWRLRGPLDVDAWKRAVGAVVDRHESLRTRFVVRESGPAQTFTPPEGLPVEEIDLTDLPPEDRTARARELLLIRTQALIDLEREPLVGSSLVRIDDDDHVWCLTMHHLVADGVSLAILSREIPLLYGAFLDGTEPQLAELPLQYGDYAVWQDDNPELLEADLAYWRQQLAGVPPLELPTDLPRPAEKGTRAAEYSHEVDGKVTDRLRRLGEEHGCTLFMVLLAGLQVMLSLQSGQDDLCVGVPVAGRVRTDFEPIVGLFANTLPMRADLSGNPTFREVLARTRTASVDALDRQAVPFGRIVAELDLPRDMSRTQVFQVIFVLHTELGSDAIEVPGLQAHGFALAAPQILHDLVCHIWLTPETTYVEYRYDSALFTPATAESMARRYENLLRAVCQNPDARLFELAMAT